MQAATSDPLLGASGKREAEEAERDKVVVEVGPEIEGERDTV